MKVSFIHHVSLLVADTGRALGFYRDVLGLSVSEQRPELGFPGAWLDVGGQQIHLLELSDGAQQGLPGHVGRDRHVAFGVEGLAGIKQRLEAHGIDYRPSRSGRSAVFCRDPDGNGVELIDVTVDRGGNGVQQESSCKPTN